MELFFFWFFLSTLCGVMAGKANRSGFGYFVLAMIISPIICFILLAILGKSETGSQEPSPDTHVKCPDCRELILKDARVCKHCGCHLVPQ